MPSLETVRKYIEEKKIERADQHLKLLQSQLGGEAQYHNLCGIVALHMNDPASALDAFELALTKNYRDLEIGLNLARTYLKLGLSEKLEELCKLLLTSYPGHPEVESYRSQV